MSILSIKPSQKPIKDYYAALDTYKKFGQSKETTVRNAFQDLLTVYARKLKWNFFEEYGITLANGNKGSVDGALLDPYSIVMGYYEAKDSDDDFKKEIKSKFDKGYPTNNILFQQPLSGVLYQNGVLVDTYDLTQPEALVRCLEDFFSFKVQEQANWEEIASQFKDRIPDSASKLVSMIEEEKKSNAKFKLAFKNFAELCRASINPNLSDPAIEEMLVQHLLTSRIFGSVFDNPDFIRRNVIASEIEIVIDALTSRSFNKREFFAPLDHFYIALERRAQSINEWSQKQSFLNTVYEKFFQGFAVKVADTHGIVYTPQSIVDFMVKSVGHILKTVFDRTLGSEGVNILDPFVGTGNYIVRTMKEIPKTKLPKKYVKELHCNEIMLLPYYISSLNIEHEYFSQTGDYKPFEGICLVDTFELAEPAQHSLFNTKNSERVEKQKHSPIFVIVGNPPYNAGQINENDNNKNRKYPVIDKRVNETYAKDSKAQLMRKLGDPYVKAYRYASDRIGDEGIVAFVSNNSFIDEVSFDGMRKHLMKDYDTIYILDLGGNVRKNPKLSGTTHNVFGIQVGVSINIMVRTGSNDKSKQNTSVYYARLDEYLRKAEKYLFLNEHHSIESIKWTELNPDSKGNWLDTGMDSHFDALIPLGSKEVRIKSQSTAKTLFRTFSHGISSNRDSVVYNFSEEYLMNSIRSFCDEYNTELYRYGQAGSPTDIDNFVKYTQIKWSRNLKRHFKNGNKLNFNDSNIRNALYRPFTKTKLYFTDIAVDEEGQNRLFFPTLNSEDENRVICVSDAGFRASFSALAVNALPDLHLCASSDGFQYFPYYVYDDDGANRIENITDWGLEQFRSKVKGSKSKELNKWDIFYYAYGILHHPEYRKKYAANLRRELPRIPISNDFWTFSEVGKKLADLHVNYEKLSEYELEEVWKKDSTLDLRVEKMKLSKDKKDILYNDKLTLRGLPPEAFEYKLGNRSAIEWIIDQYQVSTDKRSGIVNDPNREDEEDYIVKLLRKIVTLSVETVRIVAILKNLSIENV